MNKQEAFDNALFGLRKQGYKASRGTQGCAYFGEGGRRCGIGHSMPAEWEDHFRSHQDINCKGIKRVLFAKPEVRDLFGGLSSSFLETLQAIHDNYLTEDVVAHHPMLGGDPIALFEERMKKFAIEHDLVYKEPTP